MLHRHILRVLIVVCAAIAGTASGWAQVPSAAQLENQEHDKASATPLVPGANSFAESQAKALLVSKGYSQVSTLVNDSQGIWRGTAMKDDRKVDISVDFKGHVDAR